MSTKPINHRRFYTCRQTAEILHVSHQLVAATEKLALEKIRVRLLAMGVTAEMVRAALSART